MSMPPETLSPPEPVATGMIRVLGCPIECGASVGGPAMGPAAFRTAGLLDALRDLGHSVNDHGDVSVAPDAAADEPGCRNWRAVKAWTGLLARHSFDLAQAGGTPLFLGGDHAMSFGTVSGIARHCRVQGRPLALLWLDAHADFNTPQTTPSGNMHGMPVAFLTGEAGLQGLLAPGDFVPLLPAAVHLFGLRSVDREERRRVAEAGIRCTDMRMIDEFGVAVLLRRQIERLAAQGAHLHVSFDADFLDPAQAPGVGTAVPGGASYREAHLIMEMLYDSGLVGSVEVAELNPFLDERGRTARLLTELVASLFGRAVLDRPTARTRAIDAAE